MLSETKKNSNTAFSRAAWRRRRRKHSAQVNAVMPAKAESSPPICAVCGLPLESNCTIDHVVPQAIYKWNESYLDHAAFTALRKQILSPRNTVKMHRSCNEKKAEAIIDISSLHVGRKKRASLRRTREAVAPYIESFLQSKVELLETQRGRCHLCRIRLSDGGVLRRVDETSARTWDNACLICHVCNRRVGSKDVKTYHENRKARVNRTKPHRRKPQPKAAQHEKA